MMVVITLGIFVEIMYNVMNNRIYVNPFLAGALAVGVIIKSVTNYKLEREN